MSYEQTEIPRKRNDWVGMLRNLRVGDEVICDKKDRARILVSISKNFPKLPDQPYRFTTINIDKHTFKVKRLK